MKKLFSNNSKESEVVYFRPQTATLDSYQLSKVNSDVSYVPIEPRRHKLDRLLSNSSSKEVFEDRK